MRPNPTADLLLLQHIVECIDNILADTGSRRGAFFGSRTVRDAVLRNLQTLTESSQRLSDEAKAAEAGIPWRQMSATRNILVHDYLGGIDTETVWTIIEPTCLLCGKRWRE